jgi:AAA+ superfamily predicted ATPase
LAFARILGALLTDGTFRSGSGVEMYLGHELDTAAFATDYKQVAGDVAIRIRDPSGIPGDNNVYSTRMTSTFGRDIVAVTGCLNERNRKIMVPSLLLDPATPLSFKREFVAGLFGGDGIAPVPQSHDRGFQSIRFAQIRPLEELEALREQFNHLIVLLNELGVPNCWIANPCKIETGNYQLTLFVPTDRALVFHERVGFRYCCHKQQRSTIAAAYYRMGDLVLVRRKELIQRVQELTDSVNRRSAAIARGGKRVTYAMPIEKAHGVAKHEILAKGIAPLGASIIPANTVKGIVNGADLDTDRGNRNIKVSEFLRWTGSVAAFSMPIQERMERVATGNRDAAYMNVDGGRKVTYAVPRGCTVLPTFTLELISRKNIGPRRVYDLTVPKTDSFVANGIVVHNCRSRGSGGTSSDVNDKIVNQLLTKIDGVEALNNILVIGMTNRKELIDEALLRPGRFEVHIEIGLPNEEGRCQILQIHTAKMRENGVLGADVDLPSIAARTQNMTGAELTSVVKEATSFALHKLVDLQGIQQSMHEVREVTVNAEDFARALTIVKPAFGSHQETLLNILQLGDERKEEPEGDLIFQQVLGLVQDYKGPGLQRILLHGVSGAGKTFLAAKIATAVKIPFTKYLSANEVVSLSDSEKSARLVKLFRDALKTEDALLVIDDIAILCELTPPHHFSNRVVQTLKTLLGTVVTGGRLIVILCSTDYEDLEDMKLWDRVPAGCRFSL